MEEDSTDWFYEQIFFSPFFIFQEMSVAYLWQKVALNLESSILNCNVKGLNEVYLK